MRKILYTTLAIFFGVGPLLGAEARQSKSKEGFQEQHSQPDAEEVKLNAAAIEKEKNRASQKILEQKEANQKRQDQLLSLINSHLAARLRSTGNENFSQPSLLLEYQCIAKDEEISPAYIQTDLDKNGQDPIHPILAHVLSSFFHELKEQRLDWCTCVPNENRILQAVLTVQAVMEHKDPKQLLQCISIGTGSGLQEYLILKTLCEFGYRNIHLIIDEPNDMIWQGLTHKMHDLARLHRGAQIRYTRHKSEGSWEYEGVHKPRIKYTSWQEEYSITGNVDLVIQVDAIGSEEKRKVALFKSAKLQNLLISHLFSGGSMPTVICDNPQKYEPAAMEAAAAEDQGAESLPLDPAKEIEIFAKTLRGDIVTLTLSSADTGWDLKGKIYDQIGIPICEQRLIFAGREVQDERSLSQQNLSSGSTVHLVPPLRRK